MMRAGSDARLSAEAVSVRRDGRALVDTVSFSLHPGEIVAVLGPNGAGKSTLLKVMSGVLAPTSGTVRVGDAILGALHRRVLSQTIAYLPQQRTVHWPLTVERVVALGRLPHRSFSAQETDADRQSIAAAMRDMAVESFAARPITTLSGGEQARVLMARTLAQEATYIIADEPTAGLDCAHVYALGEAFQRLARAGRGIAVALHDVALAARIADRIVLMKDGMCIASGQPAAVLTKINLQTVFEADCYLSQVDGLPVFVTVKALT